MLFSTQIVRGRTKLDELHLNFLMSTEVWALEELKTMQNVKTPGPDEITLEIIK